mgnify:FL=1
MSLNISANVIGDVELRNAFNRSPKVIAGEMGELLDKAAITLTGHANPFAPVRTGALRGSIHKEGPIATKNIVFVIVGTNIFYAPFQEFGTSRGVPAKRYMTKARELTRSALPSFLKDAVGSVVSKLAKD